MEERPWTLSEKQIGLQLCLQIEVFHFEEARSKNSFIEKSFYSTNQPQ